MSIHILSNNQAELETQTMPRDFEFARPDLEACLVKRKEKIVAPVYDSMACCKAKPQMIEHYSF